jgi:hypothetical protein
MSGDQVTALYRLYEDAGALLYVGVCGKWFARVGRHAAGKSWWDQVAKVTRQPFPSRSEALAAEATAIEQEQPRYNVNGKRRPAPPAPRTVYRMPLLPPSRPGQPEQILWIEGITSQRAAAEWWERVSRGTS